MLTVKCKFEVVYYQKTNLCQVPFPNCSDKFAESQEVFSDTAVIGVCSNKDFNIENPIVWTFSMHLHLVGRRFVNDTSEVVAKYSTLPIGMYTIRECPHDQNK